MKMRTAKMLKQNAIYCIRLFFVLRPFKRNIFSGEGPRTPCVQKMEIYGFRAWAISQGTTLIYDYLNLSGAYN